MQYRHDIRDVYASQDGKDELEINKKRGIKSTEEVNELQKIY